MVVKLSGMASGRVTPMIARALLKDSRTELAGNDLRVLVHEQLLLSPFSTELVSKLTDPACT